MSKYIYGYVDCIDREIHSKLMFACNHTNVTALESNQQQVNFLKDIEVL